MLRERNQDQATATSWARASNATVRPITPEHASDRVHGKVHMSTHELTIDWKALRCHSYKRLGKRGAHAHAQHERHMIAMFKMSMP